MAILHAIRLEQITIESVEMSQAAELANLVSYANENNIHFVLAEPEFSTKAAETIASEINGQVILVSPLAEDWLNNMRSVAQSLAEALK